MNNIEIAWVFEEMADLIELSEDNVFKVRAYRKAAKTIKNLPKDLAEMWQEGKIEEIPGIGKNLKEKIVEMLTGDKCEYHQQLRSMVPPSLRELLSIPGLGPRSVRLIHERLNVKNLKELEIAAREKRIRELPGMGSKSELAILRGIEMLQQHGNSEVPIGIALPLGNLFLKDLLMLPGVTAGAICGSLRRGKELVKDIDLLIATEQPQLVRQTMQKHPQVKETVTSGTKKSVVLSWLGIKIEVRTVEPEDYWAALHHLTGSAQHHEKIRERAKSNGLKINEYGVYHIDSGEVFKLSKEEDIYDLLGMPFIPPEIRENNGEWEAALNEEIPVLINKEDYKGDLHLHTTWSDGINDIAEMAAAAAQKGYDYIAITDHSQSLSIANGLSLERLRQQQRQIKELNKENSKPYIYAGIEADILPDARLDFPDEVLRQCDVVIASIHTGLRQDKEKIAQRLEAALKNPYVNIVAHPTGRILGRREPYQVNFDRFFQLAKAEQKILEINASPDRLDLNADLARRAAYEFAIPIAINTDAHDSSRYEDIAYGILTARRAWLTKKHVVNTKNREHLERILGKSRKHHD